MTEDIHLLLGAYILGGLDAHERRQFEAHLKECPRCRDDVAAAAPLPALLSKASPEALSNGHPERSGGDVATLLRARRARRRRRTRFIAGAAATVAAAVVAAGVVLIDQPTPPRADTYAMQPLRGNASGVVTLTEKPWGTAIALNMDNLPQSGPFTLQTVDTNGAARPAATWAATPNGVGILQGATSIPRTHLRTLSIVDANNSVVAMTAV